MSAKKLKEWFDSNLAALLAEKIEEVYPAFDSDSFVQGIDGELSDLELKDRVELIADRLREHLQDDYLQGLEILLKILGPENENETGMFTEGYWLMPVAKFVEKYGLKHYEQSIEAIKEITKRHTGEYCIRPYIREYPEKTLQIMENWSRDENVHVRRLASEGVRPRLPWAKRLDQFIDDPDPVLEILENLKDDNSKFVQKSVANNLNDILKDNYSTGIARIKSWAEDPTKNRKWIIKHALRNQIKMGNPEAISIMEKID